MAAGKTAKTLDDVDLIDTTVQKSYWWIDEIGEELVEVFIEQSVLPREREPLAALNAAARVLRRHASEGETENVLLSLPPGIRRLLE